MNLQTPDSENPHSPNATAADNPLESSTSQQTLEPKRKRTEVGTIDKANKKPKIETVELMKRKIIKNPLPPETSAAGLNVSLLHSLTEKLLILQNTNPETVSILSSTIPATVSNNNVMISNKDLTFYIIGAALKVELKGDFNRGQGDRYLIALQPTTGHLDIFRTICEKTNSPEIRMSDYGITMTTFSKNRTGQQIPCNLLMVPVTMKRGKSSRTGETNLYINLTTHCFLLATGDFRGALDDDSDF
ncbi:hypothetical protein BC829DRAFT_398847 [Chytridium lagenaria]|nr:hypothetical protein BC829DRAFT_398847 [Chytridium lagenaria]